MNVNKLLHALKEYTYNGYAINAEKITVDRFINLESEVNTLREKVVKIDANLLKGYK